MREMNSPRQAGYLLAEMIVTVTVLTVGILGFMTAFQGNFRAAMDTVTEDRAQAAVENVASMLKNSTNFAALYTTYQDHQILVTEIDGYGGNAMQVSVHFDVNETTLPSDYGPVVDINGDKLKTTTNASTNYVLLPARLQITYSTSHGTETKTMYLLLSSM